MPTPTGHRRCLIRSGAGVRGRLHDEILHRLHDAGLLDSSGSTQLTWG
ncbi:hypothetical protein [Streptomyces sp. NPDC059446]